MRSVGFSPARNTSRCITRPSEYDSRSSSPRSVSNTAHLNNSLLGPTTSNKVATWVSPGRSFDIAADCRPRDVSAVSAFALHIGGQCPTLLALDRRKVSIAPTSHPLCDHAQVDLLARIAHHFVTPLVERRTFLAVVRCAELNRHLFPRSLPSFSHPHLGHRGHDDPVPAFRDSRGIVFGGGGFYMGGPLVGGSLGGIILLVLIILLVTGGIGSRA